jgi:uncharacterized repeat protein (TIGR01451 family)
MHKTDSRHSLETSVTAALLFFIAATATMPAWAQNRKATEEEIRLESHADSRLTSNLPVAIRRAPQENRIQDRYIVLFKEQVADPESEAQDIERRSGGRLHHTYGHAVKGFAATLSPAAVDALRRDPRVAFIEEDQVWHSAALPVPASPQTPAPWALDRIDQRGPTLDNSFSFPANGGAGVHIYMIDTGIMGGSNGLQGAHAEFDGRVGSGADFVVPSLDGNDCVGHGTFGSSLAAATTVGVAKLATLHPVRVLDCAEGGDSATVIAGVNWVTQDHLAHPGQKSVANMSLTLQGVDPAVDQAVQNSINAGIVYTIAAGNNGGLTSPLFAGLDNACNLSPQRVGAALTVGAMDDITHAAFGVFDEVARFSDTGGCVDLYAPGAHMTGASHVSATAMTGPPFDGLNHLGTSWSAPMVAGTAAVYYNAHPNANASQVMSAIMTNTTQNALTFQPDTSGNNKLLYLDFQTDVQTVGSSNQGAPPVGSQFTYTFQVHNNGPYNTMDPVTFTDVLPGSMALVSVNTNRGTCSINIGVTCNVGRLAVGDTAVITLVVNVLTAGTWTNSGTAALQSGQTDRAPANNAASVTVTTR